MSKRKDYMRLFVRYCIKHDIWFSVCTDGCIDGITCLSDDLDCEYNDIEAPAVKLGGKAAYEWLKETYKGLRNE